MQQYKSRFFITFAFALAAVNAAYAADGPQAFQKPVLQGRLQNTAITEASGIAASRINKNVLWMHNDSGDTARLFAADTSGRNLGAFNLYNANAIDCEDMAIGPGPVESKDYLYLGDIGDNFAQRETITIFRIPEPAVAYNQQPVDEKLMQFDALTFKYEDGPRDAETLMIDPDTADLYIVTKREAKSRLYYASGSSLRPGETITLRFKCELPWNFATGGDISAFGDAVIIRTPKGGGMWSRKRGVPIWEALKETPFQLQIPDEPQGEAIGFDRYGLGYYTVSEGKNQPIYYIKPKMASK